VFTNEEVRLFVLWLSKADKAFVVLTFLFNFGCVKTKVKRTFMKVIFFRWFRTINGNC